MDKNFNIDLLIGAHPLLFGMRPNDVENVLGPYDHKRTSSFTGNFSEYRYESGLVLGYTKTSNHLYHIGFNDSMKKVYFDDLNVFDSFPLDIIKKLMEVDKNSYEYLGFLIFLKLGITLTGFHNNEDRTFVITNDLESLKENLSEMLPYILPIDYM